MSESERQIDQETAMRLYAAAIVGSPYLAIELEQLGMSDPHSSLQDARLLRRDLLEAVEAARKEAG